MQVHPSSDYVSRVGNLSLDESMSQPSDLSELNFGSSDRTNPDEE